MSMLHVLIENRRKGCLLAKKGESVWQKGSKCICGRIRIDCNQHAKAR